MAVCSCSLFSPLFFSCPLMVLYARRPLVFVSVYLSCTGNFVRGRRHGNGSYVHVSGDKFVGEFRDGVYHGQGTFVWACGDVYQGQWRSGTMHGHGTKTMSTGDVISGEFRNGLVHGKLDVAGDGYELLQHIGG